MKARKQECFREPSLDCSKQAPPTWCWGCGAQRKGGKNLQEAFSEEAPGELSHESEVWIFADMHACVLERLYKPAAIEACCDWGNGPFSRM
jgi:hypothetical protein